MSYASPPSLGAFEFVSSATLPISHVLWNNPDGRTIFWDVNSDGSLVIAGNYPAFNDDASGNTTYQAIALSTGPDGVSHLLWTNPDGHAYLWTVQADGSFTPTFYGPFSDDGTASTIWQPVAVSTGGDNVTHVLWSNPNGRTILWDVAGDNSFTVKGNYGPQLDPATGSRYVPVALASGTGRPEPYPVEQCGRHGRCCGTWTRRTTDARTASPTGCSPTTARRTRSGRRGRSRSGRTTCRTCCGTTRTAGPSCGTWRTDGSFTHPRQLRAVPGRREREHAYTAVSLATGLDGLSHFAWDNPDGNTYLWSVRQHGRQPHRHVLPAVLGRWDG